MNNHTNAPDGLICPARDIFDVPKITAKLDAAAAVAKDGHSLRSAAVDILKVARVDGMQKIADAFAERPTQARPVTEAYAYLADQIVIAVLDLATRHLHPLSNPTQGEQLALIAVGGSGRGEMAPFSDVDLLFLTPYKITPWAESVVESMLYMLWDLQAEGWPCDPHRQRLLCDWPRGLHDPDQSGREPVSSWRRSIGPRAARTAVERPVHVYRP